MSSNGASGAFGTSPTSGYILNFLSTFVVFVASIICHAPISVMYFFIIYLVFRIKMNPNLALIPTVTSILYLARIWMRTRCQCFPEKSCIFSSESYKTFNRESMATNLCCLLVLRLQHG
jgi:hypothetical protein